MTTQLGNPGQADTNRAEQDRRTRRVTRWLLALLAVVAFAWLLHASIDPIDVDVVIDGEEVFSGMHGGIGERFALIAGCAVAGFVLLLGAGLIVPMLLAALVFVLLVVAAIVVLSVLGVPLLVVAVIALLLSPFLLLGWLLWKLLA
jgi:hypothetical protein